MSARPDLAAGVESYMTVDEVAEALRVSRWKVYELIRSRELASFRVGRCRRVPARAVADMVARLLAEVA